MYANDATTLSYAKPFRSIAQNARERLAKESNARQMPNAVVGGEPVP